MSVAACAFAIPGDPGTRTGGTVYDHRLVSALRAAGRRVRIIRTPTSFPDAPEADADAALRALRALPAGPPVVVDGLVFGALDTAGLARVAAPMVVMLHHPLGLEPGLAPDRARALIARETANLRLAAHVVVPSPHVARLLVSDFGIAERMVSVALPGVARRTPRRLPKDDPPLILTVGLICARKGHDVLLAALARLLDLDWTALFVGAEQDPTLASTLRARADAVGLSGRLRFTGGIADAELQTLYARATLFALATRYEGYGMVFAEAMRHGLPVVSCATGAVSDTVPADAGLLVPPDDPRAFADALRRLLRDPAARAARAAAARRAAAALPGWADTAAVMGGVLDRVAASRTRR
jgi:glycosyltransferase involved in cell wall biosynthesis